MDTLKTVELKLYFLYYHIKTLPYKKGQTESCAPGDQEPPPECPFADAEELSAPLHDHGHQDETDCFWFQLSGSCEEILGCNFFSFGIVIQKNAF